MDDITITLIEAQVTDILTQTGAAAQIADLQAQVTTLTEQRDAALAANDSAMDQIAGLQAKINAARAALG